ncbi:uncharacterized protein C5L36_0A00550 [Pichia kudriavzevii]|uniref:Uncharacterized protein n=2 Tax=Pichia kudriavzevii TaxID=4909 RepID=A0A2U9QWQ3_PICKU|nr:uncharacterized protein C5L36_0A00550 [Pichia kudriavzevii]AWU73443.1 hypothetical protein C5L36_0A00550 [Pichia kudriavzevii]
MYLQRRRGTLSAFFSSLPLQLEVGFMYTLFCPNVPPSYSFSAYPMKPAGRLVEEYKALQREDSLNWKRFPKVSGGRGKDRYSNVLPYAHSIVNLQNGEYINANWIRPGGDSCHGGSSSDEVEDGVKYIATQGPLATTIGTFWSMVEEQCCRYSKVCVVMLTEVAENGQEKCFDYVDGIDESVRRIGGGFDKVFEERGKVERRFYKGERMGENGCRELRHYWIREWPDFGVPNGEQDMVLKVVKEIEGVECVIVHCSAGVGRSGTFIGVDHCYRVRNGACGVPDTFDVVYNMRRCRVMMVQRMEQYEYLNKVIENI